MVKYYDLNKPIPELNNLSLTQVFEGGQLVVNPEFNDGTSGWTPLFATGSVTDGIYSLTGNGSNIATRMQYTPKTINNNDKVYAVTKLKYITSGLNYFQFSLRDGGTPRSPFIEFFNIQQNVWNDFSAIITANATSSNMSVYLANVYFDTASANGGVVQYDYVYAINLTSLGIDLTKEQMDYWFSIYQDSKGAVGSAFVQHAGIDTVIPNLNNKTLREVFESNNDIINGGLLLDNDNNGSPDNFSFMTTNLSGIENNIIFFRSSSLYGRVFQNAPYVTNNVYYYNVRFQSTSSNVFFNNGNLDELRLYHVGDGVMRNHSAIDIWGQPSSSNVQTRILDGRTSNFDNVYLEHMYKINLTSLGIDTLTQAEMDYYFSLYQSWKQKTLYIGKSKNLFDGGVQPLRIDGTTPNANDITFNPIKVIKNIPHTISFDKVGTTRRVRIAFYNNGTNVTSVGKHTIISSVDGSIDTTYGGVMFLEIYINSYSSVTLSFMGDFDEIKVNTLDTLGTLNSQLEQRTFATNYEQYYTPKTWIAPAFQQHALTDTKLIDTKLAYLNGYSIREVFESNLLVNGDFSDGNTSWNNTNITIVNEQATVTSPTITTILEQNFTKSNNDVIYITFDIDNISGSVWYFSGLGFTQTSELLGAIDGHKSYIRSVSASGYTLPFRLVNVSGNSNAILDNFYNINLTALGIDHLTQAELDQMFALYQDRNKNLLLPSENETLTQNGVTLTNLGNNRYLINGTPSTSTRIGIDNGLNYQTSFFNMLANGYKKDININNDYVTSYKYISGSKTGSVSAIAVHSVNKDNTTQYIRTSNVILTTSDNSNFENSPTYDTLVTYLYLESGETFTNYIIDIQLELGTTATPYHAYGGFSLKDVFETNNELPNSATFVSWYNSSSRSYSNKVLVNNVGNSEFSSRVNIDISSTINNTDTYYVVLKNTSNMVQDYINRYQLNGIDIDINKNAIGSFRGVVTQNNNFKNQLISTTTLVVSTFTYEHIFINLTTLNIADLTKDFMDDLYGAYSKTYQAPAFIDKYGVLNAPSFQVTAGLDTAFADLNGLTLREVFEDGNIVVNPNFDNGTTGWLSYFSTINTNNNILNVVGNGTEQRTLLQQFENLLNVTQNDKYYWNMKVRTTNQDAEYITLSQRDGAGLFEFLRLNNPTQNQWYNLTEINNIRANFTNSYIRLTTLYIDSITQNGKITQVDGKHGVYAINLTALGINLTKEQMDWYFELYKTYKGGM